MKMIAAAVAFATLMAWPTIGDAASKKSKARVATPQKTFVQPRGQTGYDARRSRSPNPQWDVYWTNGGYSGTDPDPRIRMMLQLDDPFSGDS
jgi:hypothetical protein